MPKKDLILKLIELVKNTPGIYDSSCLAYKDKNYRKDFWKTVEKEMDDPKLSDVDWSNKWKSTRDMFTRKRRARAKAEKKGEPFRACHEWVFYDSMSFLIPFLHPPTNLTSSSSSEEEDEDGSAEALEPLASPVETKPQLPRPRGRKRKNEDNSSQESPSQKQAVKSNQSSANRSESQLFMESFAPRLEVLPRHIQSIVQIQITQIFHNAENLNSHPVRIIQFPQHVQKLKRKTYS